MSIIVQKLRGKLNINANGWLMDADTYPVWMSADDLKQGDEITIERKEVDESSPPLLPPSDFDSNRPLTPEQEQEMWQYKLKYFQKLEEILHKEGLIDED